VSARQAKKLTREVARTKK